MRLVAMRGTPNRHSGWRDKDNAESSCSAEVSQHTDGKLSSAPWVYSPVRIYFAYYLYLEIVCVEDAAQVFVSGDIHIPTRKLGRVKVSKDP